MRDARFQPVDLRLPTSRAPALQNTQVEWTAVESPETVADRVAAAHADHAEHAAPAHAAARLSWDWPATAAGGRGNEAALLPSARLVLAPTPPPLRRIAIARGGEDGGASGNSGAACPPQLLAAALGALADAGALSCSAAPSVTDPRSPRRA